MRVPQTWPPILMRVWGGFMTGTVPEPNEIDLKRIMRGVRDLFEGRSNACGTLTCRIGWPASVGVSVRGLSI